MFNNPTFEKEFDTTVPFPATIIWENWYLVSYTPVCFQHFIFGLSALRFEYRVGYLWHEFYIWVYFREWNAFQSTLSTNIWRSVRGSTCGADCVSACSYELRIWFLIFHEPGTNSLWMKNVISEQGGGRFRAGGPQCYAKWTISCSAHGMIFYTTSDNCSNCSVHAEWVVNLTFLCALEFWTTGMNLVKYFKSLTMGLATLGVYWAEWQANFALRNCNSKYRGLINHYVLATTRLNAYGVWCYVRNNSMIAYMRYISLWNERMCWEFVFLWLF